MMATDIYDEQYKERERDNGKWSHRFGFNNFPGLMVQLGYKQNVSNH